VNALWSFRAAIEEEAIKSSALKDNQNTEDYLNGVTKRLEAEKREIEDAMRARFGGFKLTSIAALMAGILGMVTPDPIAATAGAIATGAAGFDMAADRKERVNVLRRPMAYAAHVERFSAYFNKD
jgi:hypothetical protein